MRRTLKFMFFAVEVNLVLWLVLAGAAMRDQLGAEPAVKMADIRWVAYVGVGFAIIVQHWAYYALYLRARELDSAQTTEKA